MTAPSTPPDPHDIDATDRLPSLPTTITGQADPFENTTVFDAGQMASLRAAGDARADAALADTHGALAEALETIADRDMNLAALRVELRQAQALADRAQASTAELDKLRALHADMQREVEGLRAAGRTLTDRFQAANARVAQVDAQLEALQQDRDELRSQLDEARTALSAGHASQLDEAPADARQLAERLQDLQAYIAGRNQAWSDMGSALQEHRDRLEEYRRELQQRERREQTWRRELQVAEAEIRRLRALPAQPVYAEVQSTAAAPAAQTETVEPESGAGCEAALVVLMGKSRLRYRLTDATVSIGRSSANDIQLSTQYISRQHVLLRSTSEGYRAEDQGSRNGVMVNGRMVRHHALQNGDEMVLGTTIFRFEQSRAANLQTPRPGAAAAAPAVPAGDGAGGKSRSEFAR